MADNRTTSQTAVRQPPHTHLFCDRTQQLESQDMDTQKQMTRAPESDQPLAGNDPQDVAQFVSAFIPEFIPVLIE